MSSKEEIPYSKTMISDDEIRITKVKFSADEKKTVINIVRGCFEKYNAEKHKIILINPNASELLIQRRWPQENYTQLIKMILDNCSKAIVLITGDPREREEAGASKSRCKMKDVLILRGK